MDVDKANTQRTRKCLIFKVIVVFSSEWFLEWTAFSAFSVSEVLSVFREPVVFVFVTHFDGAFFAGFVQNRTNRAFTTFASELFAGRTAVTAFFTEETFSRCCGCTFVFVFTVSSGETTVGAVHAVGTHAELLETDDIYREVYTSQNKAGDSHAE